MAERALPSTIATERRSIQIQDRSYCEHGVSQASSSRARNTSRVMPRWDIRRADATTKSRRDHFRSPECDRQLVMQAGRRLGVAARSASRGGALLASGAAERSCAPIIIFDKPFHTAHAPSDKICRSETRSREEQSRKTEISAACKPLRLNSARNARAVIGAMLLQGHCVPAGNMASGQRRLRFKPLRIRFRVTLTTNWVATVSLETGSFIKPHQTSVVWASTVYRARRTEDGDLSRPKPAQLLVGPEAENERKLGRWYHCKLHHSLLRPIGIRRSGRMQAFPKSTGRRRRAIITA